MGHIIMASASFRAALSEDAGVRSGLALTQDQMLAHLPKDYHLRDQLAGDGGIRMGSDEYADTVGDLLYGLGATSEPGMPTLAQRFSRRLQIEWRQVFDIDELLKLEAIARHFARLQTEGNGEPDAFHVAIKEHFAHVAYDFMDALNAAMEEEIAINPFYSRTVDASRLRALDDLFRSEKLPLDQNRFFNQSFVNYLAANPTHLGDMHWRQFEGLAAEWFQRQGYEVEIGPGRNDGSVDLRLWNANAGPSDPPTVIVQCKRQKSKIDRVIVKALFADVLFEGAANGMIVTTSDLSRGATSDIKARSYPITAANRAAVRSWILAMRKPLAGIVDTEI